MRHDLRTNETYCSALRAIRHAEAAVAYWDAEINHSDPQADNSTLYQHRQDAEANLETAISVVSEIEACC